MQYYDKQEISKKFLAEQAEKAQLLLATAGHCAGMDILEQNNDIYNYPYQMTGSVILSEYTVIDSEL